MHLPCTNFLKKVQGQWLCSFAVSTEKQRRSLHRLYIYPLSIDLLYLFDPLVLYFDFSAKLVRCVSIKFKTWILEGAA